MSQITMMSADVDIRQLHAWMGLKGIRDYDLAIHCLTNEIFTPQMSPKPFHFIRRHDAPTGTLRGYTHAQGDSIRFAVQAFASPLQAQIIEPESVQTKAMPREWPTGMSMEFQARVRPIRRVTVDTPKGRRKAERDAYNHQLATNPSPDLTREQAYASWTVEQVERLGGATILSANTIHCRMTQAVRKTHSRKAVLGYDATVRGVIRVDDSEKFNSLLARGIGRHRTYGYGMILLSPLPRNASNPQAPL